MCHGYALFILVFLLRLVIHLTRTRMCEIQISIMIINSGLVTPPSMHFIISVDVKDEVPYRLHSRCSSSSSLACGRRALPSHFAFFQYMLSASIYFVPFHTLPCARHWQRSIPRVLTTRARTGTCTDSPRTSTETSRCPHDHCEQACRVSTLVSLARRAAAAARSGRPRPPTQSRGCRGDRAVDPPKAAAVEGIEL